MNARYELSRARTLNYPNRSARDEALTPLEHRLKTLEQELQERDTQLEQLRTHILNLTTQRDSSLQYLHQNLATNLTIPQKITQPRPEE
jgi:flagellar motility protein MotE (MotC chaperone)